MKRCVIFDFAYTLVTFHFDFFSAFSKIKETYLKLGVPKNIVEKYRVPDMILMMIGVYDWMTESLPKDKADEIQGVASKVLETFEMTAVENAEPLPYCKVTLKKLRKKI